MLSSTQCLLNNLGLGDEGREGAGCDGYSWWGVSEHSEVGKPAWGRFKLGLGREGRRRLGIFIFLSPGEQRVPQSQGTSGRSTVGWAAPAWWPREGWAADLHRHRLL